jgi:hypothetical protein
MNNSILSSLLTPKVISDKVLLAFILFPLNSTKISDLKSAAALAKIAAVLAWNPILSLIISDVLIIILI